MSSSGRGTEASP